ncbi:tudor domain-containing protein krimp [Drosophila takahashii]|uniref:tudor domain-containing protein krimp n=1 Tax=Drosophila takahashii TaxID=29030 RepID=UPI001CF85545|nr:uncharacterized protein LOC108060981 [Drosophila takahashii]
MEESDFVRSNRFKFMEHIKIRPIPRNAVQYDDKADPGVKMLWTIFKNRTTLERPYCRPIVKSNANGAKILKLPMGKRKRRFLPPRGGQQLTKDSVYNSMVSKVDRFPTGIDLRITVASVEETKFFVSTLDSTSMPIKYLFLGKVPLRELEQLPDYGEIFAFYDAAENCISRIVVYASPEQGSYDAYQLDFGEYIRLCGTEPIFQLPDHIKKLPSEAIRCTLDTPGDTLEMKSLICRNVRLRVLFNDGFDLLVKLIRDESKIPERAVPEESSEEMPMDADDMEVAAAFAATVPVLPKVGSTVRIHVSHVSGPNEFYGQFVDGPDPPVWQDSEVLKGQVGFKALDIVLAQFSDGRYYRAKIMDMTDGEYYVFFVDFGRSAFANPNTLAPCQGVDKMRAFLAYRFQIEGLRTTKFMFYDKTAEGIAYLKKKLLSKEIDVTIAAIQPRDGFLIRFQGELADMKENLVKRGYVYRDE